MEATETSKVDPRKFILVESSSVPLEMVSYEDIRSTILVNPITGGQYKGIVLKGVFADLSNRMPNSNFRYYDLNSYLYMVQVLKQQIFSKHGVYGELEHPEKYTPNYNNASHKLIDVWYDPSTMCVMGMLILLDTPGGLKAQEIVKSGGCLAVSARAAGQETKNPDGTFNCSVKVLTTYDLVYKPGFPNALLDFYCLNESTGSPNGKLSTLGYFSGIIYDDELATMKTEYALFESCDESRFMPFYQWYFSKQALKPLMEAEKEGNQDKKDQEKMQEGDVPNQDKLEGKMKSSADKELNESDDTAQSMFKESFFKQVDMAQQRREPFKGVLSYHDEEGSGGFVPGENMSGVTFEPSV
jgi:hypothetical protein